MKTIKRIIKKILRRWGLLDVVEVVKVRRYAVEQSQGFVGKNILITGGSSGIGLAIAKKCLDCGAKVMIVGRDEGRLSEALAQDMTGRLMTMVWDLSDISSFESRVAEVFARFDGKLDILVNNAGISIREKYGSLTADVWQRIIQTNLTSPVFLTQSIANKWRGLNSEGVVLFVSSMAGVEPAFDAYGASKCALCSMSKGIARTFAPDGIRVNTIAPGVVIGTNLRDIQRSIKPDGNVECPWIPAHRYSVPEEMAEAAVFMISDRASYMNGAVVVCDGAGVLRQ